MSDVWSDISSEFLHLYPRGRRLIAVAGADAERSRRAADDLATALIAAGQHVERAHSTDADEAALRGDVIAPFRTGSDPATVLIVSGPAVLLSPTARGLWNFIVWQLAGDEAPHSIAGAIVDVTDPAAPTRRFADYCALPSSFGA
ncbi:MULTISPECIES: hypothetical protein [unclassified Microbacterium]|uniref:hypothetical protein n=1 Tax=unclassified Microbacterium TaxID=2609290 RepID=UPI0006FB81D7|nr:MULTISPECIES: hypothetical protein [unclassified Microbacterium]KRD50762.1 hypothetical protein ASE34_14675 [Microbacterium sp. Root280D1]CAH0134279.1 hypothetical protein SRABI98_00375 [Microbacterium sp. Bi98]